MSLLQGLRPLSVYRHHYQIQKPTHFFRRPFDLSLALPMSFQSDINLEKITKLLEHPDALVRHAALDSIYQRDTPEGICY